MSWGMEVGATLRVPKQRHPVPGRGGDLGDVKEKARAYCARWRDR